MEPILNKKNIADLIGYIDGLTGYIREHSSKNIPDSFKKGIQDSLNKAFGVDKRDDCDKARCRSVMITDNVDRVFFGCFIKMDLPWGPVLHGHDLSDITLSSFDYTIDIDSRLFSMELDLVPGQIVSLILHDVYRMTSFDALTDAVGVIDAVLAGRRDTFSYRALNNNRLKELLNYSILDYLYRSRSIFAKKENDLVRVPELLSAYELDSAFVEALDPIFKNKDKMSEDINHPSLTVNWAINVILNYQAGYVDVMGILRALRDTCPSTVQQNYLSSIILKFISMSSSLNVAKTNTPKYTTATEASLFNGIRKSGLKSLENDLFEYEMRVKNIDDENSAILLMRQINNRMGVISDYLEEENLSDSERRRWQAVYDRYDKLRVKIGRASCRERVLLGV